MPQGSKVKPTHKAVKSYYAALATYADQSVQHEGALRSAFQNLLSETARKVRWTLIPELSLNTNRHQIRPDGTFRDELTTQSPERKRRVKGGQPVSPRLPGAGFA